MLLQERRPPVNAKYRYAVIFEVEGELRSVHTYAGDLGTPFAGDLLRPSYNVPLRNWENASGV